MVNQSLQAGAALANVLSIVKITSAFVPFLNVAVNLTAGTTTFLKIVADDQRSAEEKKNSNSNGDYFSLVGNVAGVVAGFAVLAGAVPLAGLFTGVGVVAALAGLINSDSAKKIHDSVLVPLLANNFGDNLETSYPDHFVSPDMRLVSRATIDSDHAGMIAAIRINPETGEVSIGSTPLEPKPPEPPEPPEPKDGKGAAGSDAGDDDAGSGGGSSGGAGGGSGGGFPGGSGSGSDGGSPGGNEEGGEKSGHGLGINIEIIRDKMPHEQDQLPPDPQPTPPDPTPHPPHPIPPEDAQDTYGCCTNTQDTYA